MHEATKWRETRNDVLSQHKLMEVAMGGKPDGVDEIVDVPLASIPRLPPGHPMEYKVQMDYMHAVRTNKANEAKRFRLWTDAWTQVYNIIIESVRDTDEQLARELRVACDLRARGVVTQHTRT